MKYRRLLCSGVISARQLHQSILAVFLQIETIFFSQKLLLLLTQEDSLQYIRPTTSINGWLLVKVGLGHESAISLNPVPSSLHRPYCHVVTKADKTITTDILFIIAAA